MNGKERRKEVGKAEGGVSPSAQIKVAGAVAGKASGINALPKAPSPLFLLPLIALCLEERHN